LRKTTKNTAITITATTAAKLTAIGKGEPELIGLAVGLDEGLAEGLAEGDEIGDDVGVGVVVDAGVGEADGIVSIVSNSGPPRVPGATVTLLMAIEVISAIHMLPFSEGGTKRSI
jgi:hypothetical protein